MRKRKGNTEEIHPKLLRLPASLPAQLRDLAEANDRSTEGEIRFALRQHVKANASQEAA